VDAISWSQASEIEIVLGSNVLRGTLELVTGASGLVLFVHGSGSSRFSSRNQAVAHDLQSGGLSTLLFDLLSDDEERIDEITRELRFDIDLLSERVISVTDWLQQQEETRKLRIGYFGASTGAAAALRAAAHFSDQQEVVQAAVSRGGRPDLALEVLPLVTAPTLLIVGGNDETVIQLNRRAFASLTTTKDLRIVPGAGHLFEEPGALDEVSRLTRDWFTRHLGEH
jgi:putative phosphoribosyl transferase